MKVHYRKVIESIVGNVSTLLFVLGLLVLCAGVSQWSKPAALAIAGVTLMVIGAMPSVVLLTRARARKDS